MEDSYVTIKTQGEAIFKDKGSKFFAFAQHVGSEEEADFVRKNFKKKYYDATHVVYAFRLGYDGQKFRAADDGEPSGSSGVPVLNKMKSAGITDAIVVVVRYFGGTKLGIPGLINAYGTAAEMAIENAEKQICLVTNTICVSTTYAKLNYVMRIVKEYDLKVLEMNGSESCNLKIEVRKNITESV